jgi:hypothetical protein
MASLELPFSIKCYQENISESKEEKLNRTDWRNIAGQESIPVVVPSHFI